MFKRRRYANREAPKKTPRRRRSEGSSPAHPVLRLQGRLGNAGTSRLIQALHDREGLQRQPIEEEEELAQAKFERVQRQEEEEEEIQPKQDPAMAQRQEGLEEEVDMARDPGAAPQVGLDGGTVPEATASEIDRRRGGGSGLDSTLRENMESAFGTSFEGVRVHEDAGSDALARNLTARAFTTGSDVFLRSDASSGDRDLMAHELTHVVQQRSGVTESAGMTVRPAGDALETEADEVAARVNRTDQPEEQPE
ncbi:MAG: DUF4157 domain-containing protein [Dehalococcoidia bacterium]